MFFTANLLTEETAFGLLHLFSHLHDSAFTILHNDDGVTFNAQVLDLLSPDVVPEHGATSPFHLKCHNLQFNFVDAALSLEESSGRIHCQRVVIAGNLTAENYASLLISTAGAICDDLCFRKFWTMDVDYVIEVGCSITQLRNVFSSL